jgi:hypothetical protein
MAGCHPRTAANDHKQKDRKLMSDPQTARKYIQAAQPPEQLQEKRGWRTRPDPLAAIWEPARKMLSQTPELEAKELFEYLRGIRPESAPRFAGGASPIGPGMAEKLVADPERVVANIEAAFPAPHRMDRFFGFETQLFHIAVPERLGLDVQG